VDVLRFYVLRFYFIWSEDHVSYATLTYAGRRAAQKHHMTTGVVMCMLVLNIEMIGHTGTSVIRNLICRNNIPALFTMR
jgi:hypothetical protein